MSKITDLIPVLYEKTLQKKLSWEIGSQTDVWVKVGANIIEVESVTGDSLYFLVVIRNKDGEIVDQEAVSARNLYFDNLSDMVASAQRQARKADESIDNILHQLEKL